MPFWSAAGTSPHWTKILVGLVMCPWTSDGGAFGAVEKKRDKLIKCFLKGAVSRLSRSFCKKTPAMRPFSLWNLRNYLWMTKSERCVKQNISPKHHINRYKRQQMNFEKLLGAQVFKIQNCNPLKTSCSLSIRPSFLYLLCHSYLLLTCFLSGYYFTQFGGSSHAIVSMLINSVRMV